MSWLRDEHGDVRLAALVIAALILALVVFYTASYGGCGSCRDSLP